MARRTGIQLTPKQAKARLRMVAARTRPPLPNPKPSHRVLIAFGVGLIAGWRPNYARAALREFVLPLCTRVPR